MQIIDRSMNKLRVGLMVKQYLTPTEGGGFSYHETLLQGINNHVFHEDIEIVNIILYKGKKPQVNLSKPCIFIKTGLGSSLKDTVKQIVPQKKTTTFTTRNPLVNYFYTMVVARQNRKVEQLLRDENIDLVYYLKPELHVLNYPFIITHWDVAHKSMDAFPETTMHKNYEVRERYYLYQLNKAFAILCESQTGARELLKYYTLYENKVKVLPMFASNLIHLQVSSSDQQQILEKFQLTSNKFFLYPAQFWSCKNHYNLVLAFAALVKEVNDPALKLMLCGSDMGNLAYIKQVVASLSLTDRIILPGFVSNQELAAFYQHAICLTMPTFLGPTNIPLMEAAHFKCPVLCSNLEGHKEIMGDAAIYCDPLQVDEIKDGMRRFLDNSTQEDFRDRAYTHILNSPFNLAKSLDELNTILLETRSKRKAWGIDYFL